MAFPVGRVELVKSRFASPKFPGRHGQEAAEEAGERVIPHDPCDGRFGPPEFFEGFHHRERVALESLEFCGQSHPAEFRLDQSLDDRVGQSPLGLGFSSMVLRNARAASSGVGGIRKVSPSVFLTILQVAAGIRPRTQGGLIGSCRSAKRHLEPPV